ncbi:MAG: DUF2809 domain-containing protein [bacterium]|nr:DUF2809 domain-containing protein [bacterium]
MNRLTKSNNRRRLIYAELVILVILLGYGSRENIHVLPEWLGAYSGDTLWALMVYLGMGFVFARISILRAGAGALVFSFSIELSQIYHTPWIDGIRATTIGGLVLGRGFLWSDLVCYTAGAVIGVLLELFFLGKEQKND